MTDDDITPSIHQTDNTAINNTRISLMKIKHRRKRLKFHKKLFRQERHNRKLYQLSKTKNLTITCPDLNNVTFTNSPPFNILGIPQCTDAVKPKFRYLPN